LFEVWYHYQGLATELGVLMDALGYAEFMNFGIHRWYLCFGAETIKTHEQAIGDIEGVALDPCYHQGMCHSQYFREHL
jgi:hypothetical protein